MTTPQGHRDWAGIEQVHGFNHVLSDGAQLAAGASILHKVPIIRPGYVIDLSPQYVSTNGANPFVDMQLKWFDAGQNQDIGPMSTWTVKTLANGIYNPTLGQGPVRGQICYVTITNLDSAQPIVPNLDMYECSHHISRDDWRDSDMFGWHAPPGFTASIGAAPSRNVLTEFVGTPNGLTNYLLPLYAGQAWLSYQITVPAGQVGELFISPYNNTGVRYFDTGAIPASTVTQNAVAVTLPRKPCFMQLSHSGTTTVFYAVTITTMEYAS